MQNISSLLNINKDIIQTELQIEKYLFDSKELTTNLYHLFRKDDYNKSLSVLLKSDCGTGKNYTVHSILAKIIGEAQQGINPMILNQKVPYTIISLPNISSVLQFSATYNVLKYYGEEKVPCQEILRNRIIVTTYDKTYEVFSILRYSCNVNKIHLVIDEAHELVKIQEYRDRALNSVQKCIKSISSLNCGNILYLSATPESVIGAFSLDHFINVNSAKREDVTIRIQQLTNSNNERYKDNCLAHIINLINQDKFPFIQVNDKKMIDFMMTKLESLGYKSAEITSDDNQRVITLSDGTKVHHNKVYQSILDSGIIPTEINNQHINAVFTTSVINNSINIYGTASEMKLVPIYYVINENKLDTDMIVQFLNRFRNHQDDVYLMIPESKMTDTTFSSIEEAVSSYNNDITLSMNSVNEFVAAIAHRYDLNNTSDLEVLKNHINTELCRYAGDDLTNNLNGILYFNTATSMVEIDTCAYEAERSRIVNTLLFNRIDLLMDKLVSMTGFTAQIMPAVISGIRDKQDKVMMKQLNQERQTKSIRHAIYVSQNVETVYDAYQSNCLNEVLTEARMECIDSDNKLRCIAILGTKDDLMKASQCLAENNENGYSAIKYDCMKRLITNPSIMNYLYNRCSQSKNGQHYNLSREEYNQCDTLLQDADMYKFLKYACMTESIESVKYMVLKSVDTSELLHELRLRTLKMNNCRYLANVAMLGIIGYEQGIIIRTIGTTKQKKITEAVILQIKNALLAGRTTKKSYSKKYIAELIRDIYRIRDDKGLFDFTVKSLRIESDMIDELAS